MRYVGPEYDLRGAKCERWVEVEYKVDVVSGEPYGITTSCGNYVREAPEPPIDEPADPESYERQALARTKEVLRRTMDEERELRVLRDVRLEGSYPDTCVVVSYWDPRNPAPARERIYRERRLPEPKIDDDVS